MNNTIRISQADYNHLQDLLARETGGTPEEKNTREQLFRELMRARIEPEVPPDVIGLHSRARLLDIENGEEMEFTLVPPDGADVDAGRISIFAPLGTAMIGFGTGDEFEWPMPGGTVRMRVLEVQPQQVTAGAS